MHGPFVWEFLTRFDRILIQLQGAVLFDHDHNGSILGGIGRGLVRIGRLGRDRLQSMRRQGRDHHEDDQQHQQNVDQRRHVNIGFGSAAASHIHGHKECSLKKTQTISRAAPADD